MLKTRPIMLTFIRHFLGMLVASAFAGMMVAIMFTTIVMVLGATASVGSKVLITLAGATAFALTITTLEKLIDVMG